MIGIVIVAHGGLAVEFKAAVEHVVGKQAGLIAISIGPNDDRAAKQAEISAAANLVDVGDGVVVVTDMFGGSPSNLSLQASAPPDRKIAYGVNLPMLIKLVKSRQLPMPDAVRMALAAGRKYIDAFDGPKEESE
ncbi:PTS sugar transporter subunit IIA [Oceaniglobus ichthyenteri]|uniref:PTS sugar transporter subunit IIA n=1 Tax=Oceaniglobus ichthyenteri TaxID=2136177 RepID=UPI000D3CF45D|nr:PTS fructose transporter subunit IIA [Oceaniglobus ichthyenteri]